MSLSRSKIAYTPMWFALIFAVCQQAQVSSTQFKTTLLIPEGKLINTRYLEPANPKQHHPNEKPFYVLYLMH